jgi:hypothetical protein
MKKYLVTFKYEILELHGFAIVSQEDLDYLKDEIEKLEFPYESHYGNHTMYFQNKNYLDNCLTIKELSEEGVVNLNILFDLSTCGDWGYDPRCLAGDY